MMEIFTTAYNLTTKGTDMSEAEYVTNIGDEAASFYNSLHHDLNKLKKQPAQNVVNHILNYSKNHKG